MRLRRGAVLGLGALLAWAAPARGQTRALFWRVLEVSAELDRDGRLHVQERQAMVFSGDWNGGERQFRLGRGQRLELGSLGRLDGGSLRRLTPGDPPQVDQYVWAGPGLLRWRSRAPSDPPFRQTEIVYVIDYTLSNVLDHRDGLYHLDHDFAFPDRPGPIERFTLELRLDPAWRSSWPLARRFERGPLPPGASFPVRLALAHEGRSAPAAVDEGSPGLRRALLLTLVLAAGARLALFWRGERAAGRLAAPVRREEVDADWLGRQLFSLPAEVVGAIWDRSVGPPEVAALLARMEAAGRIQTWVDTEHATVQHLRLVRPRESLAPLERALMDALLVKGRDVTDTGSVKRHYQSGGFDPAGVIRPPLEASVREVLGPDRRTSPLAWLTTLGLLAVALPALAIGLYEGDDAALLVAPAVGVPVYLLGLVVAQRWRRRVDSGAGTALGLAVCGAGLVLAALILFFHQPRVSVPGLLGVVALALGAIHSMLNHARSREAPAALAVRKRLTAARRFFESRLRERPDVVPDPWVPYLLALGLARDASRWATARPSASSDEVGSPGSPGWGSRSRGSESPTFSGGGGRFGGAGATASWAAAAQAFAVSIPAPSSSGGSSSGGSSGGGGSSSSGGGGGGGW